MATLRICRSATTHSARQQVAVPARLPSYNGGVALRRGSSRSIVSCPASGPGVLDNPVTTPSYDKSTDSSKKRPPIYNVMLHNDNYNRREYVVKTLLKVVDCINLDDAMQVMNEAHQSGVALVTSCPQEDAERYTEGLRLHGLTSSMEPSR